MTTRTIPIEATDPVALDLAMNAGIIRITVSPAVKYGYVTLKTDAENGPSTDAVRNATAVLGRQELKIRVPDTGPSGGVTFHGGGVVVTGSMSNVSIINGRVYSNGREITPGDQVGSPPVTAEIHLPPQSSAKLMTQSASTEITGSLERLEYDASSGRLTAERVGDLDAALTSGELLVGQVTGTLDVTLTSGSVNVGAYSGHDARLNLTSGNVHLAATAQATGRLSVKATSGSVRVTGAGHLNVRRRVTSGHVQIS